jgi:O-antigen ligase
VIISQRGRSSQRATFDLQLRGILAPGYILLCLVLGGASAGGAVANGLLQLTAIGLMAWAILDSRAAPLSPAARRLAGLGLCLIALIAIQLLPLPPALWQILPGHDVVTEGYRLMKMPMPWLPISLSPAATVSSALGLLPAVATALLVSRMPASGIDILRLLVPMVAVLSVLLGLAQLVGGPESPLYFYDKTNKGLPVGFFANVNHQATLLLMAFPFLAALEARSRNSRGARATEAGRRLLLGSVVTLLAIGIVITGSVAAYVMAIPVAVGSWILIQRDRSAGVSLALAAVVIGVTAGAILLAAFSPVALNLGTSFGGPLSRPAIYATMVDAIPNYLLFGSGVGSFPLVFPMFEDPAQVTRIYANHAHNDYLELILETGLPGLLLLAASLFWWGRRAVLVWRGRGNRIFLERAAAIASAVVLIHSLVDYPARTAAIMSLFAACLAILAVPVPPARERVEGKSGVGGGHISAD